MPQKTIFIIFPVIFLAAYIYTAVRLYKLMPETTQLRIIVPILFIAAIIAMLLFFTLGEKMSISVAGSLYVFSTGWLIAFLYFMIAVIFIDAFRLINSVFHFLDKNIVYRFFTNNTTTSLIVFGSVALILIYGNIQYHNKKRHHINIESDKIHSPVRVVGISDLHIGYTISAGEVEKWVKLINSEKPDIVIIAGDIIDNHLRPLMQDSTDNVLSKINARLGVFACTGNHDLMFAVNEDTNFYERAGITLLRDSSYSLNGITVIGRDDHSNRKRKNLNRIMESVDKSTFTILLEHQPLKLEEAIDQNIDFQLSGHTHRGQIFPISLITDKIFELSNGYLKKENTHFFVSTGLGIWGGKFRIGTRSEYLVLDLMPS
ncbi:MAG: metallophosphoesterase [Fermentimonas sp.]|nr:metallophosphoesterase [Fermentimonas sp.]MDD4696438.1 metallophosphoesterase [Fermentimonas sp.]